MKIEYVVDINAKGDFNSISEAVNAVPYSLEATIYIKKGIYREKLFIEKNNLTLIGEDREETVISWDDGAFDLHSDGRPLGTFRSYTSFLGGERLSVSNLTIENTAGDGETAGQAIAAYVDARQAYFENVSLKGRQDTLFIAPLPQKERLPNGFLGPRQHTPRFSSRQFYKNCYIEGDIDFIFGGGDAFFSECRIFSKDRGKAVNGYISAPNTVEGGVGFVFHCCNFDSDCKNGTVYLARPWRSTARAVFISCNMGEHIHREGFHNWGIKENEESAFFAEYHSTGLGGNTLGRVPWSKQLDNLTAETILKNFTGTT